MLNSIDFQSRWSLLIFVPAFQKTNKCKSDFKIFANLHLKLYSPSQLMEDCELRLVWNMSPGEIVNRLGRGGGEDRGYLCNYMYSYKTVSTTIPLQLCCILLCVVCGIVSIFFSHLDPTGFLDLGFYLYWNGLSINDIIFLWTYTE